MDPHDLTAAYALDALDPDEVEAYERHLSQCEECRLELAGFNETATNLAFASVAPAPPERLRASILEAAATERSNVVPLLRRRWVGRGLAVAAAVAACIVVGFVVSLSQPSHPQATSVIVLMNPDKTAKLTFSSLPAAPAGKTYEAWVIPPTTGVPRPAGTFSGGGSTTVQVHGQVPQNAVLAVTVEPAGGSSHPTTTPIFSART